MYRNLAAVTALIALSVISKGNLADAADIKVIGSTGVRGVVTELAGQFETSSNHKVVMDFDVFAVLKRRIDAGEEFDIAILSPSLVDDLIKQGKLAADTQVVIGRTGMGAAVYRGAPRPDITSVEAFKRTLLNARSVGYPKEGASGTHFLSTLERLGITDRMKAKLRPFEGGGPPLEAFAKGEPELVVGGTTLFPAMPGAEVLGAFPSELQNYIVFTAAVSATAKEPQAASPNYS
jgi:molybdate transport system substrate-binding protein